VDVEEGRKQPFRVLPLSPRVGMRFGPPPPCASVAIPEFFVKLTQSLGWTVVFGRKFLYASFSRGRPFPYHPTVFPRSLFGFRFVVSFVPSCGAFRLYPLPMIGVPKSANKPVPAPCLGPINRPSPPPAGLLVCCLRPLAFDELQLNRHPSFFHELLAIGKPP